MRAVECLRLRERSSGKRFSWTATEVTRVPTEDQNAEVTATTPADVTALLNRVTAMVEANVNPSDINYRGDSKAYRALHGELEMALRELGIAFPFPWKTLEESASHLKMTASGSGSWSLPGKSCGVSLLQL